MKINCLLLVDDDNINNYLSARLFKKMEVTNTIKVVANGMEALNYVTQYCSMDKDVCCPDLILLDINMPMMNGLEFLEAYNKINDELVHKSRIVVLTTSSHENDMRKIKELGGADHMNKPLTEEKIQQLLLD